MYLFHFQNEYTLFDTCMYTFLKKMGKFLFVHVKFICYLFVYTFESNNFLYEMV